MVVESVAVYVEYVSDIACLTLLVQNEVDGIELLFACVFAASGSHEKGLCPISPS